MIDISICSYSFHRLLADGKQDIFRYITDCKELGCTLLDPWNSHLAPIRTGDDAFKAGKSPEGAKLTAQDREYLTRVKAAADQAGLPFGCIAVDGAHIYEADSAARARNRAVAYRWLEVASLLGARQVRIDAGGPEDMPEPAFTIIREGFQDLIGRARKLGVEILTENHWGPTKHPEQCVRLLEAVEGLGMLFDTNNWAEGKQQQGWELCAKYARCTHVKTFSFDDKGNEPSVDLSKAIRLLVATGYKGPWGVESCPKDGDEYAGARKTIALIRRELSRKK